MTYPLQMGRSRESSLSTLWISEVDLYLGLYLYFRVTLGSLFEMLVAWDNPAAVLWHWHLYFYREAVVWQTYNILKPRHIVFFLFSLTCGLICVFFYTKSRALMYHRASKTKILEYLRDGWAKDRRAEWSIWMVYSKVEMPHHYINSGSEEPSNLAIRRSTVHKRVSSLWKLADDVSGHFTELFHIRTRS